MKLAKVYKKKTCELTCVYSKTSSSYKKTLYDENSSECTQSNLESTEDSFKMHYSLYIVDQAIDSHNKRFEQYSTYENIFEILFNIERLKSFYDENLKHGNSYDLYGEILYEELKFIREILAVESKSSFMILSSLKTLNCFSNACISYRIILTIHVIVASTKRSFSKLKLLKSYLRPTMSQIML